MRRFLQNATVRGDHHLCPIPGTKVFRRTYEIGSEWTKDTSQTTSQLSGDQMEQVLKFSGVKYHIEELTWKEEVGTCDFECKQAHFVIKT